LYTEILNVIHVLQLALRASQLLEQTKLSELRSNIARNLSELEMFTEDGGEGTPGRRRSAVEERMEALVNAPLAVEDALVALFDHSDHTLQRRVIETYVRRLYQPYLVKGSVRMQWHRSGLIASWQFWEENPAPTADLVKNHLVTSEDESRGVKRWGSMVILTSLQLLSNAVKAALNETEGTLTQTTKPSTHRGALGSPRRNHSFVGAPSGFGNVLHVALVGIKNQMSAFQDRCHSLLPS
jgi:acetyl-CoA carboxylase/biotin carboxylase 1